MSDEEVIEFVASLLINADNYAVRAVVPASVTRDPTDSMLLALAEASSAVFLVTNDCRHLLRLGQYRQTQIVTPARFLRQLS